MPGASDDAIIPSGGNQPTISTSVTTFHSLTVNSGAILTITSAGTLNVSGAADISGTVTNAGAVAIGGTLTFRAGATYNHNRDGGTIPTATWNVASTVAVTGVTTTAPSGLGQAFGNFTWSSSGQTANINLGGALSSNSGSSVGGTLTIANTGSGSLRMLDVEFHA